MADGGAEIRNAIVKNGICDLCSEAMRMHSTNIDTLERCIDVTTSGVSQLTVRVLNQGVLCSCGIV